MSRTLVTGGAGFIGSHVVRHLLERGDDVVVLDDLSSGRRENLPGGEVDLRVGDVRDESAVAEAVRTCEAVVHLAAIASVTRSIEDPVGADSVTHGGTVNVAVQAVTAGVSSFVLASSCAVYGDTTVLPTPESVRPAPRSPYAVSKLLSEGACTGLAGETGMLCLRFFNVFGPRQDAASEYSGVIARFLAAAAGGEGVTVYGDGRQSRDFVAVADVARAVLLALGGARPGDPAVLNIGSGRETTLLDLLAACRRVTGATLHARHVPPRAGDIVASCADIGLARARLGYEPRVALEDALAETYAWWREQPR